MKAKYRLLRTWDVRYEQVYCFDNIFLVVVTHEGSWKQDDPAPRVEVCLTNAEARHMFFECCNKLEKDHYECIYKEETT